MSNFLRQTGRIARLSRSHIEAPSRLSHTPPTFLSTTPRYTWGHQRCRRYATVQPDDPKDPKDKKGSTADAKSPKATRPSRAQDTRNATQKQAEARLKREEEEAIDRLVGFLSQGMPPAQRKMMEQEFLEVRKQGIPKEMWDIIHDLDAGKHIDLATAAKLMRMTTQMARRGAERSDSETSTLDSEQSAHPQQKTAHDPGPSGQQQKGDKQDQGSQTGFSAQFDGQTLVLAAFVSFLLYRMVAPGENLREITWQEFRSTFLDKGLVEKVIVLNHTQAKVYLHRDAVRALYPDSPAAQGNFYYYFTIGSVESFEKKLDDAQKELQIPSSQSIPVAYQQATSWFSTLLSFGPQLLGLAVTVWFFRRISSTGGSNSGIFGMGRSRAKRFNHETDIKVKFADVAGMDEAKMEIMEFVSFLKDPGMYQKLGAKIPRGAILSGPPGTGKTLLAKATAGESGVPFFSVSGSEFVEMFVGVGSSRVRDLFATARKNTPCIIFIDEIDAIGKSRQKNNFSGNDEREATLNQILTEMDGFNTSEQVVVMAGTNRVDILDAALLRPGRFDRHIQIDKPTMEGRKQIFAVHLKKIVTKEDQDYLEGRLAALTPGFSGADIANCVNEAALIAARNRADSVEMAHFEQAIERVIGGLEKKSLVLSPEEKRTVAYHEAGHAICGWYFQYADPLLKVSIIPRGQGVLGYAQYLPAGDTYLKNVHQLMDRMAMTLGGRVSEELHFDSVTSGASDDFKKVTRMASAMVTKFGMSKKVGMLFFEDENQQSFQKPFSEETARNIDLEVKRIVDEAYKQCKDLLTEKKKEVGIVAEELLKKEMLSRDDMVRLLGKRPFEDEAQFTKYFGGKRDREGLDSDIPPPPSPPPMHPPGDSPAPSPAFSSRQP